MDVEKLGSAARSVNFPHRFGQRPFNVPAFILLK